jgi:N6-adenosine-specific RNA methylase IME4
MHVGDIRIGDRHRKELHDIEALAQSIADVGLLHPVVVTPDGTLVAGQRRLAAVMMLGWADVPVTVVDIDEIIMGEYAENTYREDFTPTEAVAIGRAIEEREREKAKARQLAQLRQGDRAPVVESFHNGDQGKTRDKVGEVVGMSGRSYEKARQVVEAAEERPERFGDLPEMMDDSSINRAYREMRKRESLETPPLPDNRYRVLYADPPWYYAQSIDKYGPADRHYPTMQTPAICELGDKITEITADDAVLFLWSTAPKLKDALSVAEAWGFRYTGAMFIWDKIKHNYGHYNSVRHELLLICTRGSCTPDVPKLFDSVQAIERTDSHSEKPQEFRDIIDTLYTHGKRIELFARKESPGWDIWGKEA